MIGSIPVDEHYILGRWSEALRDQFAELHTDPDVMADLGGPYDREASDAKFDRYRDEWRRSGISRWPVIHEQTKRLVGYVGVMCRHDESHPLGLHYEIGWRLLHSVWGQGLATRGAKAALAHAWSVLHVTEIVSYTATENLRSQGVMKRLGLRRDCKRDFVATYPRGVWHGLVWVADSPHAPL